MWRNARTILVHCWDFDKKELVPIDEALNTAIAENVTRGEAFEIHFAGSASEVSYPQALLVIGTPWEHNVTVGGNVHVETGI